MSNDDESTKQLLLRKLTEFSENASMHGIFFVFKKNTSVFIRYWFCRVDKMLKRETKFTHVAKPNRKATNS